MQLFTRDSGKVFNSLATSLSLAVANYKPIPQLPTSNDEVANYSAVSTAKSLLVGGAPQISFRTAAASNATNQTTSESDWGQPSLLFVPQDSATSRVQKATATVGPGQCAIQSKYTPAGGWDALPAPVFPAFDPVMANVYRYRQQQGVNLGAWFVQEGWMQSSFFSCAQGGSGEINILYGFGNSPDGIGNATAYMEQHWDTWITEADFKDMANKGINTVRLPIGYWSAGPYFTNNSPFSDYAQVYYYSWRYVARAINWAAKYNIGVLVDLHGAYGSQNGQDHSGVGTGQIDFFQQGNLDATTNLLVWMTQELANVTNLVGIQLLNEPVWRNELWPWYTKTMDAMRKVSSTVPLYFHDAFDLNTGANFVSKRSDFVVSDHHSYYVYTPSDTSMSVVSHIAQLNGDIKNQYQSQSDVARRNLIQGEWSCALAPGSLAQAKNQSFAQTNFCNYQEAVYRSTGSGYFFWSWNMENCQNNGGWCFKQSSGSFLPSNYDSWGLYGNTSKFTTNSTLLSQLLAKIDQIPLPAQNSGSTNTAQSNKVLKAVGEVPRIGMVTRDDEEELEKRDQVAWQVGGSLASRAKALVQMEKRQSTTSFASASGWSDGFLSARIMAAQGNLSRIGFAPQYQMDSFAIRMNKGQLAKSDASTYNSSFVAGTLAANAQITQIILDA